MNTLQWFMNLSHIERRAVIDSVKAGIKYAKEDHHKSKLRELLQNLKEDHHFANTGEKRGS